MSTAKATKQIEIQPRDKLVLAGLLDARFLTIKHAAALYFEGRFEAAKKRLQKLITAGLIARRPRRPQDQAIHVLGRRGYRHLLKQGLIDPREHLSWEKLKKRQQVSDFFLRHELAVMDVKVAFTKALQARPDLQLIEFGTIPERDAFSVVEAYPGTVSGVSFRSCLAKPDGFMHIRQSLADGQSRDHYFYLEVDRSTETLRRLVQKGRHYSQHYRKGGFACKFGHPKEDFKKHPFRVLFVVRSAERRTNIAEKLSAVRTPIKNLVWLTTMAELLADPLGAIWFRPTDCRNTSKNSPIRPSQNNMQVVYRRDRESKRLMAAEKQKLFSQ